MDNDNFKKQMSSDDFRTRMAALNKREEQLQYKIKRETVLIVVAIYALAAALVVMLVRSV